VVFALPPFSLMKAMRRGIVLTPKAGAIHACSRKGTAE
jgi:hypothetical protein